MRRRKKLELINKLYAELTETEVQLASIQSFIESVIPTKNTITLDIFTQEVELSEDDNVNTVITGYGCEVDQSIMLKVFAIITKELKSDKKVIENNLKELL